MGQRVSSLPAPQESGRGHLAFHSLMRTCPLLGSPTDRRDHKPRFPFTRARKAIGMPQVCSQAQRSVRLVRRAARGPRPELILRPVWPSPFTSQPSADAWIEDEGDGVLTLYVGDRCLSVIRGLPPDQFSLNYLLDRFRRSPPRPRR